MTLLRRRGPDGGRMWASEDRSIIMLHARLAVQDLTEAAAQPMAGKRARSRLVYNGEIYNTMELRERLASEGVRFATRSDTEVLLHALERWGAHTTLERVRGMFAFVWVDGDRLVAAVDHAGMKPLMYRHDPGGIEGGGRLTIASECDTICALLGERELDLESVEDLLSVGYVAAPRTMYRRICKLGPGQVLEWRIGDSAGPRVTAYWRPPEEVSGVPVRADELLAVVAREHCIGDREVAVFLSAGIDSTALAAVLPSGLSLAALTLNPGDASDECAVAEETSRLLGMRHERVAISAGSLSDLLADAAAAYDEPQGFTALLTSVAMTRAVLARGPHAPRVILGGDGGDEAFGGYAWHRDPVDHPLNLAAGLSGIPHAGQLAGRVALPEATADERHAAMMSLATRSYAHRYLVRTFGGFHPVEAAALVGGNVAAGDERFGAWLSTEDRPALPHPRRAQRLDVLGFCAGSILPKLDRAAGAMGLEMRSPWLDRRVLDAWLGAPVVHSEHTQPGSKPLLREIVARAAAARRVSPQVLSRPKQGFSLRLPGTEPMEAMIPIIERSALVRDGVIRQDWMRFVPAPGTLVGRSSRAQRLCVLGMLGAWYERRFNG
ncbi:MAG: asparagine synthase (glutamine-hydrolyzing) [Phycisphaerales bacterium]|nr:asparagine synthase (glutamine-hydrolyzing) [Phycisphaerales bacterium]